MKCHGCGAEHRSKSLHQVKTVVRVSYLCTPCWAVRTADLKEKERQAEARKKMKRPPCEDGGPHLWEVATTNQTMSCRRCGRQEDVVQPQKLSFSEWKV